MKYLKVLEILVYILGIVGLFLVFVFDKRQPGGLLLVITLVTIAGINYYRNGNIHIR